ncbi:MAG: hypothetical protein R3Y19_00470 [Rikenellaceae bacterium]
MAVKHYIKCEKCMQLVELRSEYMVLCPNCGVKMTNSYSQWQQVNPGATFQQYLSSCAVSGAAISGSADQRRIGRSIKRRQRGGWVAIALGCAVALFLVVASIFWFTRNLRDSSIDAIIESNWNLNYYEDLQSTLQFPYALKLVTDTTFAQPDTIVGARRIVARQWTKEEVCSVTSMKVDFSGDNDIDREGATSMILQSMVGENSMEAFQYIPSDYELNGSKVRMFSGSYLISTVLYEFRAVLILRSDQLWYNMVAYPTTSPEGTILADKFFKTIQINQ